MNWLKNYERIIAIEQQLVWQPVTELDPRTYVPEVIIVIASFISIVNCNVCLSVCLFFCLFQRL